GVRRLVRPGAAVLCLALWAFTTLGPSSPLWTFIAMHVVLVIGLSFMFTPLMTDALGLLPPGLDSHGSAILSTLQQVAGAAGTALFITVMSLASSGAGGHTDAAGAYAAFLTAAIISTAALPVVLLVGRSRNP
ncbi:MAG: MFS transporter, partial [Pseudonocardia sp.]|nr:MFS transporter [Pseudonocardia sp.]